MPSASALRYGAASLGALALAGTAAAGSTPEPDLGLGVGIAARFAAGFVVYGLLGAAVVGLAPQYGRERVDATRSDPAGAFVWGLAVTVLVPVLLVLLAVTVVGILVAFPGLLVYVGVTLAGTGVTVVLLGGSLAGSADGPAAVAVGAGVLAAVGAVPVVGELFVRLASLFGVGAVGRSLYRAWRG